MNAIRMDAATRTLTVLALFLIGCAGPLVPDPEPSSCSRCPDGSILCMTTLDDCIRDGHGTCHAGNLELSSDGITSTYAVQGMEGTWQMQDKDVVLDGTVRIRLYYEGEVCQ